jgi:hypothetical protein
MKVPVTVATAILLVVVSARSTRAQESIQERLQTATVLQSRIADLQAQVVNSPDDRNILRTLLEAGLQYYELGIRSRFPDTVRNEILELKIAMQDMYSIQRAVSEMGWPTGIDGDQLVNRLKSKKLPQSYKRSVPLVDPWGTPYRIFVYSETGRFKIVSAGRDKKFDTVEFGISEKELDSQAPERRNASLDDDIVFIDGRNFTRIFDYPKDAQSFLYTPCEPADELRRFRCW